MILLTDAFQLHGTTGSYSFRLFFFLICNDPSMISMTKRIALYKLIQTYLHTNLKIIK